MEEIWKDVVGYEGYYQVSNKGNVVGLERIITNTLGRKYTIPAKELTQFIDRYGYVYVTLSRNKKTVKKKVHRLVAEAFIPNTENKPTVNHKIDGDKLNNYVDNLEWFTVHEQNSHSKRKPITVLVEGKIIVFETSLEASKTLKTCSKTLTKILRRERSPKQGIYEVLF